MTTATRWVPKVLVGLVLAGMAIAACGSADRPDQDAATPDHSSTPTSPAPEPDVSPPPSPSPSTPAATDAPPATPEPSAHPLSPTTVTASFWGFDAATATAQVGGYADVVETGGTCTLVLTRGDDRVSVAGASQPDAASTTCGTLSIPRSELSAGSWTAELSYTSATSMGVAPTITIEVP